MANNYAQQLTPEQIAQIMAAGQYGTTNINGLNYGLTGQEQNNEGGTSFTPNGFLGYEPGNMGKGASRAEYGLNGGFAQMGHNETPSMKDGIVPLLFALGAAGFAPGGMFAGDGGAGGVAFDGGGDFFGAGGDAAAGGADGAMGMGSWGSGGLGGAGGAGADFGMGAGGAASGAGGLGSLLDSAGGLGGIAKYALPVIGGLLGSKGVQSSASHDLPPEMKPYVYGQGGLLPGASQLFQQQTAPGGMPGYTQMQAVGQGLLNQPIAGNGVAQFNAMPRFGAPRR